MELLAVFGIAAGLWAVGGVWLLICRARRPAGGAAASALARGLPIDLESAGLSGTIWTLRTADGLDLPVWDVDGHGEGPTTILLHDWGGAPLVMLPRAAAVAETSGRVILPTMRGHDGAGGGCSLGPREVDDLRRLLDVLDLDVCELEGSGLAASVVLHVQGDSRVSTARLDDPWPSRRDGLGRILRGWGFPAWPIVPLAAAVWWLSAGASSR